MPSFLHNTSPLGRMLGSCITWDNGGIVFSAESIYLSLGYQ